METYQSEEEKEVVIQEPIVEKKPEPILMTIKKEPSQKSIKIIEKVEEKKKEEEKKVEVKEKTPKPKKVKVEKPKPEIKRKVITGPLVVEERDIFEHSTPRM